MIRKLALIIVASSMAAPAAMAQEGAFELSASAGYTLSDGVTFAGVPVHDEVFNRIEPKDAFSFHATLGYFVQDDVLIEFLWSRQKSTLELGGTTILDLGDLNVDNYMGQIAWHFNDSDEPVHGAWMDPLRKRLLHRRGWRPAADERQESVLRFPGGGHQGLSGRGQRGTQAQYPLDADVHQVRSRRNLV